MCLSSQTSCAELTLRILGIGPGDEVIVPAYTYTATASIIYHVGAKPVMIDCKSGSFEMDYDKMEAAINHNTKVIIPVDLAGVVCDYDRIFEAVERKKSVFNPRNELQEKFGRVIVMADGAHAFGAQWHGKMCGEIADFTNFSFHAVKNMTTAEGGAAVHRSHDGIDEEEMYKQYMLLSLHGQTKDAYQKNKVASWEYDVVDTQYKCNMTDVLAAIGVAQLERYDKILDRRHQLIKLYNEEFKDLPVQVLNHCDEDHRNSKNGKGAPTTTVYWPKMKAQSEDDAHAKGIMMRDERYKYISRTVGKDELYDLQADPQETTNRIDDESLAPVVVDMQRKMLKWLEATDDIVPFELDERFTPEMLWARVRGLVPPEKEAEVRKMIADGTPFPVLMGYCHSLK